MEQIMHVAQLKKKKKKECSYILATFTGMRHSNTNQQRFSLLREYIYVFTENVEKKRILLCLQHLPSNTSPPS